MGREVIRHRPIRCPCGVHARKPHFLRTHLEGKITALRALGRYDEAERTIQEGLSRIPGSPAILIQQGWLYLNQNRHDQAISAFQEVLGLAPKQIAAMLAEQGWQYLNENRFDQALFAFGKALAIAPHDESALEGRTPEVFLPWV